MSERDRHKARYYSGKKPYLTHNYRTMMKKKTQEEYYSHELNTDPMSELLKPYWRNPEVPGFGWEYMAPEDHWPPFEGPGGGWGGPIPGDCRMACNDSMLDCEGGCTTIPCICAGGGLAASIAWDDGGKARIAGTTPVSVIVCTDDVSDSASGEYPSIGVEITGGSGEKQVVRVALVDCRQCCDEPVITGSETVVAGADWTGTVNPPCPGGTVGCGGDACAEVDVSISEDGATITADTTGSACGSFYVTLTDICSEFTVNGPAVRVTGASAWCIEYPELDCTCEPPLCPDGCPSCITAIHNVYCHGGSMDTCTRMSWSCGCEVEPGCPNTCAAECGSISECVNGWTCTDEPCTCIRRNYAVWQWKCKADCGVKCVPGAPAYPCWSTTVCSTICVEF